MMEETHKACIRKFRQQEDESARPLSLTGQNALFKS